MGSSRVSAGRTSNGKTKCPTGTYMVGLDCEGDGQCSAIQLKCAAIDYKSRDPKCSDDESEGNPGNPGDNVPDDFVSEVPRPPQSCRDWRLPSGETWTDTSRKNCDYYERWGQCSRYGNRFRNYYTANEACCACGGGSRL